MFNNKPATQGTVNNNSFPTTLGNFITPDSSVGLFGNRSQNVDNKQQKGANDNNNISHPKFSNKPPNNNPFASSGQASISFNPKPAQYKIIEQK